MVQINFQDEMVIEESDLSLSLLDIALKHGLPLLHICGRCAQCSTCQVEVLENPENIAPRNIIEENHARERNLEDKTRLACQSYLTGDVTVRRRVKEDISVDDLILNSVQLSGNEQDLGILFCDIRDFTGLTNRMQPYDLFHTLNRYYTKMGEIILKHHGYIHQYYGDGILALFGFYARESKQICLDAVSAGLEMLEELKDFNTYLMRNFDEEFKIGIGINFGRVMAGKIGHEKHRQLTVIGDVVNMTQRIEDATKKAKCPILISDRVYWELGGTVVKVRPYLTELKGKPGEHRLYQVQGFIPGHKSFRYGT